MKGRKSTILLLAALLSLSIPAAFAADTFSVDYTFESVVGECGEMLVRDSRIQEIPGEPLIPYKAAAILLPQNGVVKDVKVKHSTPIVQKGIDLPWGQPPCTYSDEPVKVGRNEEIYDSDNVYPKNLFEVTGVEYCKGFAILNVHLYPVQYQPKSGTIHFYETMTVDVQFGKGMKSKLYRGLQSDKTDVAGLVDNPENVGTYDEGPTPLVTEEYIIITSDTLQSTFQTLANHKAAYVNGATVYTVSWIYSNYTGADNQMKIRNFIIDKYTNNGTKYVLLGGDTGVVPYRGFYVYSAGYIDTDMAADMYFGHLDGTFNNDGDSYWAEPGDGVDWYAEVAIGRAPVDNTAEAENFVNKVITYRRTPRYKRVLLHQSRVQTGNDPDSRCLAYNCDDYIPDYYTIDYLFEEDGTVTKAEWINQWAQCPVVVVHMGHGSATSCCINYELDELVTWSNSDVASLTNIFYPWTTSVACIAGQIEYDDCLAEAYVMDADHGAIAAIYNDNYGWYSTLDACMYSGEFCEMEFRACWSDGCEKFGELLNQARSYLVSSAQSNCTYRWCFYERNLIGDPESSSLFSSPPPDTVTITSPHNGDQVSETVSITVSITGWIDEVEFSIDGVLEYTDTTAPFEYVWDTTVYAEGLHTISVKGYFTGVFRDEDDINITVDNIAPYITITNPQEGEIISRTVLITTDTHDIDTVEFYIDGELKYTDTTAPFEYEWKTKKHKDGTYIVTVKGYASGIFIDDDSITVTIKNKRHSIALLSFLVFFLPAAIVSGRY